MKSIRFMLVIILLLAPIGPSIAAAQGAPVTVVLTANMVTSAIDIEAAINQATEYGTRPGVVIFDGHGGPFVYAPEAEDVDINIFVSHLTLRGVNNAKLQGGGVTFDGMDLSNITIENLWVICPADCITSPEGQHINITVRHNRIEAPNFGIAVGPKADGWLVDHNRITSGNIAVQLLSTTRIKVINNQLSAAALGITLEGTAQGNLIIANQIRDVHEAGIALGEETWANKVHANQVTCAHDAPTCVVVDDLGIDNQVQGNR